MMIIKSDDVVLVSDMYQKMGEDQASTAKADINVALEHVLLRMNFSSI